MNLYKPQHIVNGNDVFEDLVDCPYRDVVNKLFSEKERLEKFLSDLEVAKNMINSRTSPIAGMLEKAQLDFIDEMLGLKKP